MLFIMMWNVLGYHILSYFTIIFLKEDIKKCKSVMISLKIKIFKKNRTQSMLDFVELPIKGLKILIIC